MITISTKAAEHISKSLENRRKGIGIRIGLKKSGCSGYSYVLEYVDTSLDTDTIFDLPDDKKLIIDNKNLPYLDGMELDYVKKGLNEGFEFRNPNVTAECGCGESFSVS